MRFALKWTHYAQSSYTFGSRIQFLGQQVSFENPLMSPSFPIISWSSRTNFQGDRKSPDLPLLARGKTYQLALKAKVQPANSLYVKVTYFDRFGDQVGFETLKDDKWQFTYPEEAYAYRIELINAGCERVLFDHLLLSDLESARGTDQVTPSLATQLENCRLDEPCQLIFLEPEDGGTLSDLVLGHFSQPVLVSLSPKRHYLDRQVMAEQLASLAAFKSQGGQLTVIGYGPYGNLASLAYASSLGVTAFVTEDFWSAAAYQMSLQDLGQAVPDLLAKLGQGEQVVSYGRGAGQDLGQRHGELLQSLWSKSYRLTQLPDQVKKGDA